MPSDLRDPKTIGDWLELDYVARPRRGRGWAAACLVGLAVAGAFAGYFFVTGRHSGFQAGPLSTAHAMLANDCGACHDRALAPLGRFVWGAGHRSVSDAACLKCHAGALHYEGQGDSHRCVDCHKEHRGNQALSRVADGHCTSCHADLKRDDGRATQVNHSVTAFLPPPRHPDYLPVKDEGTIQFNHAKHLKADGVQTLDLRQLARQLKQVEEQGGKASEDLLKVPTGVRHLQCQDCHQPDAAGRYMLPVRHEQHCRECHPLSVSLIGDLDEPQRRAAVGFAATPLTHPAAGQTAHVILGQLRDRVTRFIQAGENRQAFLKLAPAPDPGRPIPGVARPRPLDEREHEWANRQQGELARLLFDGAGGCQYCHKETTTPTDRPGGVPTYAPPAMPERWQKHAEFSHKSHRMLACDKCHPDATGSAATADVLVPKAITTCMDCHHAGGGARADCVECHLYHAPAKRSQGRHRGDPRLDPTR